MSIFVIDNVLLDKDTKVTNYLAKKRIYPLKLKSMSNSLLNSIYRDSIDYFEAKEDLGISQLEESPNIFFKDINNNIKNNLIYRKNFVLVIIESLGYINDPLIRDFVLNPLNDEYLLENFYVGSQRLDALQGSTVTSEFRELCGIYHSDFNNINRDLICAPKIFNDLGYETHSVHPYLGGYFNRRVWWKDIGFKHRNFMTRIDNSFYKKCSGSYVSYCDDEFFSEIFKSIYTANDPFFLYYLSIEGHLPTKRVSSDEIDKCIENTKIKTQFICESLIINREMIRTIINSLKELEVTGTDLYLIGDHTPKHPFVSSSPKLYSENNVQVITFKSKK
ncbi:sulfatase-like hydrolase/transferase [Gammaproteobacteria bacterium]|nr:sulfatase-like hydrolase/transferase [Gammaproteobacteria bacterium]